MKHWHCLRFFGALLTGPLTAIAAGAPPGVHPNYQAIVPGLDYACIQTTNWNNGDPWSIHIARLNRAQKNLRLVESLAHHQVLGVAPVSAIAKAFPAAQGQPLVAINAGFCIRTKNAYQGVPRGIGKEAPAAMVIVEGEIVSAPSKYSFWVNEDGTMHFGRFDSRFNVTLPDGSVLPIGLNNECTPDGVMLYTHLLGTSTRATNHLEVVLEEASQKRLSWRVGESCVLQVRELNPTGNTALSPHTAVLGFGAEMAAKASGLKRGDKIRVKLETAPALKNVVTACHAIFPIVENGRPLEAFDTNDVMKHKNPRTAIGFNEKYFFMVVVDGRQKQLSLGMTARELAEFMALLGCTEAMNLDGGGSSTFWMQGRTRNSVPGGKERVRGDALVIVQQPGKKTIETAARNAGQ